MPSSLGTSLLRAPGLPNQRGAARRLCPWAGLLPALEAKACGILRSCKITGRIRPFHFFFPPRCRHEGSRRGCELPKVVKVVAAGRLEAGIPHPQSMSLLAHPGCELLRKELDKHQYQGCTGNKRSPEGTGSAQDHSPLVARPTPPPPPQALLRALEPPPLRSA